MNIVRIIIAIVLFILFCWLNWWVLPDLAIVRFSEKRNPIPQSGYLLLVRENKEITGFRIIKDIEADWDGVLAAWPYVVIGTLLGLGIGYVAGEFVRRKFAIEMASENAIRKASVIMYMAKDREGQAEGMLIQVAKKEKQTNEMYSTLIKSIDEYQIARAKAEEYIATGEAMQQKVEATERELTKARRTIEKLERQTKRLKRENEEKN